MSTETLKYFRDNTLTEKKIIIRLITEMGGNLYPYLLYLENTGKQAEAELIKDYRKAIFNARDGYTTDTLTNLNVIVVLDEVFRQLQIQLIMLSQIVGREWESSFFTSYMNELVEFKYLLKPNPES